MRIDSRFLRWGVFFIVLGAVPLAVAQGWIDPAKVGSWWRFWPLILVGIGVGLILRRTPVHVLGGLIVAATFGLLFGGLLAGGAPDGLELGCTSGRSGVAVSPIAGTFGPSASVNLDMSCGDLTVEAVAGSAWTLIASTPGGRNPVVASGPDRLEVRSAERGLLGPFGGEDGESWKVGLPTDPTVDLRATLNAGSAQLGLAGMHLRALAMTTNAGRTRMDLSGANVGTLSYTLNAGETRILLPATALTGSATVNAGQLGLCLVPGTALRVVSNSTLASNNFAERGLVANGSTWTTPGYDSAPVRIDLSLSANAGSIELDPDGGCR
ncbi:MAG: hypothetical protein QOF11_2792 [Chloroflexota bacterium]|jgi:hypothetical protein|nr:hypothetical protein [Chloroflexota bacterium]